MFKNLQSLRGIAALFVCFFHLSFLVKSSFLNSVFRHGYMGVDVFFIISGVIMVVITQNMSGNVFRNLKIFFLKRLIRIIPLYYSTTLIWILITHRQAYYFKTHLGDFLRALLFIPFPSSQTDSLYPFPPLFVGWSLNYEIFFYIIFGLSFIFKSLRYAFLFVVFGTLLITGQVLKIGSGFSSPHVTTVNSYIDFFTNQILFFFVIGVLLALILPYVKIKKKGSILCLLLSTILFILLYVQIIPNFLIPRLLISGFFVFSFLLSDKCNLFSIPAMQYLGDISYSIYLIHPIIIAFLPEFLKKIGLGILNYPQVYIFIFILILLISSAISFEIIEKRVTHFLRQKLIKTSVV